MCGLMGRMKDSRNERTYECIINTFIGSLLTVSIDL